MQRRDQVVVLFAILVVDGGASLQEFAQRLGVEGAQRLQREEFFGKREQIAPIAIGEIAERDPGFVGERQLLAQQRLAALKQVFKRLVIQALQNEHLRAGKQRRVDLKAWIFGGGADEGDDALFHIGQKAVLLGAVEAMDFVDEEQRSL